MPINAHPEFLHAEKQYLLAQTLEQKIEFLKEMLSTMPSHKGAENLSAELRTRYKKLTQKLERTKKSGKSKKSGIKKQAIQAIVAGFPNTGKSSVFKILTNQSPKISPYPFTTNTPQLGTLEFEDTKIQIIDLSPFPNHDQSLLNSTDTIILVIDNLNQIEKAQPYLQKSKAKKIILLNKIDLLNEQQKRKLTQALSSKKLNFILFSSITKQNLQELKNKIFSSFPVIRIYTKEPKKQKSKEPIILKQNSLSL